MNPLPQGFTPGGVCGIEGALGPADLVSCVAKTTTLLTSQQGSVEMCREELWTLQ